MIKRYILHIEFHRGYRPRISLKRIPRPGDVVVDGGEIGTLIVCPECGGEGLLHQVDPRRYFQAPPIPPIMSENFKMEMLRKAQEDQDRSNRPRTSDHAPSMAVDFNAPEPWVDIRVDSQIPNSTEEVMPPEKLELDYTLGTNKYKGGELLYTHRGEYIVDGIYDNVLYLIRKDVYEREHRPRRDDDPAI